MAWEDWKSKKQSADTAFAGTAYSVRCYESHPVLKIGKGRLYGGSARNPVKEMDVYVVLQNGDQGGRQSDPWDKQAVTEIYYGINDMHAPSNVARFKKLVTWICTQLQAGKKVHVGCIGGHGRTGTVLSAIIAEALKEKDAIQWVRKHYCKKAVESKDQVAFLMKHYGVTQAKATKDYTGLLRRDSIEPVRTAGQMPLLQPSWVNTPVGQVKSGTTKRAVPEKATKSYGPMASVRSLWKPKRGI